MYAAGDLAGAVAHLKAWRLSNQVEVPFNSAEDVSGSVEILMAEALQFDPRALERDLLRKEHAAAVEALMRERSDAQKWLKEVERRLKEHGVDLVACPVVEVSRDDLRAIGYDPTRITDDDLRRLADDCAGEYLAEVFAEQLVEKAALRFLPRLNPDERTWLVCDAAGSILRVEVYTLARAQREAAAFPHFILQTEVDGVPVTLDAFLKEQGHVG